MTDQASVDSKRTGSFRMPVKDVGTISAPTLSFKFLWEFICDGRTPARAMTDEIMRKMLPALEGSGTILELGAGGDYYKRFCKSDQSYVTSNFAAGAGDIVLDMTHIELADNSVDAIVSVFALEHLFDFESAFREKLRVLKPAGRLLLVVPFLYYYHAAPDDYFRFSGSALDRLLAPYNILCRQPLGGRWLLFSEFLHEKEVMGSRLGVLKRFLLRCVALPFLMVALRRNDPKYAMGFAYLCEKKG